MRNKGHAEEDPPVLFRKIEVTRVKVALKKKTNGNLDRMRGGGDRTVLRSISLDQLFCVVAIHSTLLLLAKQRCGRTLRSPVTFFHTTKRRRCTRLCDDFRLLPSFPLLPSRKKQEYFAKRNNRSKYSFR